MKRIILLFLMLASLCACAQNQNKRRVIIDTDAGNGIDDYYAVARLLMEGSIDVAAINAAHYNNPTQMIYHIYGADSLNAYDTALESYRCCMEIAAACRRTDVPVNQGTNFLIGDPWEQTDLPSPSAASAAIIREAHSLPSGEKLYIICIGAATNVASAILESPDIVPSLSIWVMGGRYYPETGYLDKGEFNSKNDLNAFDLLLKTEGLEIHLMDGIVSDKLEFDLKKCDERFRRLDTSLGRLLAKRWKEVNYDPPQLILWDLAITEAFLNPSVAKEETVSAYTKNGKRDISIFTRIDVPEIEKSFWKHYNAQK